MGAHYDWGVKISITKGVPIPQWIRCAPGITISEQVKYQTRYMLIEIPKGHAMFLGGVVHVVLNGNGKNSAANYQLAFDRPTDVLEIRGLSGHLLKDNHRLCHRCYINTESYRTVALGDERYDVHFQCAHCKKRWSKWNIPWIFHPNS